MHHAGNSSGVVDGAAAVLMASPEYAKAHGMTAAGAHRGHGQHGRLSHLMLNAPVPAARKVLEKAGHERSTISTCSRSTKPSPWSTEKFIRDLGP